VHNDDDSAEGDEGDESDYSDSAADELYPELDETV
jgi:hypothetical protein